MGKGRKENSEIDRILNLIKEKNEAIESEIQKLADKKAKQISIPVSVFNEKLGMLEAASLYLKDELDLSFNDIAKLLKRDYKTIWTSYRQAKKKLKE